MKPIKPIFALVGAIIVITLMLPTLLVLPFTEETASGKLGEELRKSKEEQEAAVTTASGPVIDVAVYRSAKKRLETLPLEEYLVGVVAAEMPAEFEIEALKAQALTARTYIVKQMMSDSKVGLPDGALVTDTVMHQVYKSNDELKEIWGIDYKWKLQRITDAVSATQGQILTFKGEPITATFFSTSNGYTENSEAYWSNPFPYLKSVESPWDKESPKFTDTKVLSIADFQSKLGVKLTDAKSIGKVIERTPGKRVAKVDINGKTLTGKEIREKLDLRSTDFSWLRKGDNIVITTKGYGHGVGMSQYGANGMAAEGKNYEDIVKYYYNGVELAQSENFMTKITAKK